MSVADKFMPSVASLNAGITDPSFMSHGPSRVDRRREPVSQALEQARRWATNASEHLLKQFPAWELRTEAFGQSPAWAIIEKADEWKPDLIVLGSHNRSALGRLFLVSPTIRPGRTKRCLILFRQLNNKSALLQELNDIKRKTRDRHKAYWAEKQKIDQQALEGGCPK